jgi:hypothetical protein
LTVAEMLRDHDQKIDSLLDWRSELRGAMALVQSGWDARRPRAGLRSLQLLTWGARFRPE